MKLQQISSGVVFGVIMPVIGPRLQGIIVRTVQGDPLGIKRIFRLSTVVSIFNLRADLIVIETVGAQNIVLQIFDIDASAGLHALGQKIETIVFSV